MKIQLEAGNTNHLAITGRHFGILSSATDDLHVEIRAKGQIIYTGNLKRGIALDMSDRNDFPDPFDKITLTSETAQQVDIFASLVKAYDNRLSGNFDLNAALSVAQTAPKSAAVPTIQTVDATGFTEVLPERAARKSALVQVDGEVMVLSDDSPVVSGAFTWETQAPLVLKAASGSVEVRILETWG